MAVKNNEVVATLECEMCGGVATLHETKRGTKKGLLYKRCGCGCDQRTGAEIQKSWRKNMIVREGYEHLKPTPEPTPEPKHEPTPEPIGKKSKSKAPVLVSIIAAVSGIFLIVKGL